MVLNFFAGSVSVQRRAQIGVDSIKKFVISAESVRFLTFVCFFGFIGFSIVMNRWLVVPRLLPEENDDGTFVDRGQCGPFEDKIENDIVDRRYGFDVLTESHLQAWFGFSNICTNWDYSPSRELTAMVFPLFEYSIVAYFILNYIQCGIQHKRGELSDGYMRAMKILTPIQIIFCIWFRLIFVYIAYESPRGHTMGFMFLQYALIIMNIMNPLYVLETNQSYKFLDFLGCGKFNGTRVFAWTNMIITLVVALAKLYSTTYIVFDFGDVDNTGIIFPPFYRNTMFLGKIVGWWVDKVFMIFVATMPLLISFARWKVEPAMTVEFDLLYANQKARAMGEGTPLVA